MTTKITQDRLLSPNAHIAQLKREIRDLYKRIDSQMRVVSDGDERLRLHNLELERALDDAIDERDRQKTRADAAEKALAQKTGAR
jgi:hypothetical protein